jgi:hypothetical protein
MLHTAIVVKDEDDWKNIEALLSQVVQGESGRCSMLQTQTLARMRLAVLYDKYDFNEIGLKYHCDNRVLVKLNMPEKLISIYLDDNFDYEEECGKRKCDDIS